ncbi:hypothetical protein BC830DRAFT_1113671 [Chytriomyces sp. MP71]|nr:hypothetical protein BC830DRAFT_1113671 [Chytriomyces sp. MP71]
MVLLSLGSLYFLMNEGTMGESTDTNGISIQQVAVTLNWVMASISILGTVVIIGFVVFLEAPILAKARNELVQTMIFTPVNVLLVIVSASLNVLYPVQALSYSVVLEGMKVGVSRERPPVLEAIIAICVATSEVGYILYSWIRSRSLVKSQFPKCYQFARSLMRASPVMYLLQCIPAVIKACEISFINSSTLTVAHNIMIGICAMIFLVMDTLFLSVFIIHLRKWNMTEQKDFTIIAFFGLMGCVLAFVSTGAFLVSSAYGQGPMGSLLYTVCVSLFELIGSCMLLIKVRLFLLREEENRDQSIAGIKKAASMAKLDMGTQDYHATHPTVNRLVMEKSDSHFSSDVPR